MEYTILVVDDDEPIHIMTDNLLNEEYSLIHAKNAQEAIDLLSEKPVNLILSDIHMPGISGLEFLESLMNDAQKREIPVLIMTNLPTVEKEKKALDLGAADFVDKTLFNEDKEEILKRIRMKLVTSIRIPDLDSELSASKDKLVSKVMSEAIKGDFNSTVQHFCQELKSRFEIDFSALWGISGDRPNRVATLGIDPPESYGAEDLLGEVSYQQLSERKKSYMTNHVYSEDVGIMQKFSEEHDLPAEIGVPLFAIDERKLLMHNMSIPDDAKLFGFLVLKRNKLFTSKEFEVISRLTIQTGSILWRLFKKQ